MTPDLAALHLRAVQELQRDRPEAAEPLLRAVLALAPADPGALFNLAYVHRRTGRLEAALDCYAQVARLAPDMPGLALSYASAEAAAGRSRAAIARLRAALRRAPGDADLCNQLGGTLLGEGACRRALAWFRRALREDPGLHQARLGEALALLSLGRYRAGWAAYESRWDDPAFRQGEPERTAPLWQGEPLAGRTLLVHAEQGLGDTLQFLRYLTPLHARGARLVVEVQKPLLALVRDSVGKLAAQVIATGAPPPPHDWHCPLMSLPHRLGTTLATVPAAVPYLATPAAARRRWKAWMDRNGLAPGCGRRIGLACSGAPCHSEDALRSLPAARLLAALPADAAPVLVQPAPRPADAAALARAGVRLPVLRDFRDTAALMENLDLVVSIDSAPAHLAGALGRPVWVLLPHAADFRWLRERTDSPWYPTARLFRQPAPGDWAPPLAALAAALA